MSDDRTKADLTLCLMTWDPGSVATSPDAFATALIERVRQAWDRGADLVLLPELLWMGLEPLLPEGQRHARGVAQSLQQDLLPRLQRELGTEHKAVLLGSGPHALAGGELRNRAHLLLSGHCQHQDKLHLTPWESLFSPGETLQIMNWRGWNLATLICLDIEVPELAACLRGRGVDLILCPSATETLLGVERINRCASARAVELGCAVAVSALTGSARSELIDCNLGRCGLYLPSQQAFAAELRQNLQEVRHEGCHEHWVRLPAQPLEQMRLNDQETNPATLRAKPILTENHNTPSQREP